jgi:hypothetical protein
MHDDVGAGGWDFVSEGGNVISTIPFALAGAIPVSFLIALFTGEWRWLLLSVICYLLIRRM